MTAQAPRRVPLLAVEPLRPEHLPALAPVLRHEAVYRHLGGVVPSFDDFVLGLTRALAGPTPDRAADFPGERWLNHLMRDAASGRMVGRLEATLVPGRAEVAFLLDPAAWGRGYATAGLQWLHEEIARVAGPVACWATTLPENTRCQALLARCGYERLDLAELPRQPPLASYDTGDWIYRRREASAARIDALPPGPRPPLGTAEATARLRAAGTRTALLVEGWSDQAALHALARRRGVDLAERDIAVVPIGGITNVGKFVEALGPGPGGLGLRLGGLCDAGELPHLLSALHRTGAIAAPVRALAEAGGFHVCEADLEDELIRALGPAALEAVLAAEGELEAFHRFRAQPAQRGRAPAALLHRFLGTRARRKVRYGTLLVEALDLGRTPAPLQQVLERVLRPCPAPAGGR